MADALADPQTDAAFCAEILTQLRQQRASRIKGGFYWENQIAFAYNSNKIEGSRLTERQTRAIFETSTVSQDPDAPHSPHVDDVIEARNHFHLFDLALDTLDQLLTRELLWEFHSTLKRGTSQDLGDPDFVVGGWKKLANRVADVSTTPPPLVDTEIAKLLDAYNAKATKTIGDIASFHYLYERIHPFQDGNGRTGRMIAFRECLKNGIIPFIVKDSERNRYYSSLASFPNDPLPLVRFFEDMQYLYWSSYKGLLPTNALIDNQYEMPELDFGLFDK